MKQYIIAGIIAVLISFGFGIVWYLVFGYDSGASLLNNFLYIFKDASFWRGLFLWSVLYFLFITLPVTVIKRDWDRR